MIAPSPTDLPRGERRLIVAAFLSLFGILAAQSLLETARDALFLAQVPIARLPWMYLAMAAITLLVTRISNAPTGGGGRARAAMVPLSLAIGAALTAGLAAALSRAGVAAVYLLFLWSGVFSAHAVTQVWTVLGESLDMTLAKRLYGRLAAGGGLGAVAGAALAHLLSRHFEARHMVWVAAAMLAITAIGPAFTLRSRIGVAPIQGTTGGAARRQRSRLLEHPYVTRLLLAALIAGRCRR